MKNEKVVKNQDKVAKLIVDFMAGSLDPVAARVKVEAVGDDGSVCVQVSGSAEDTYKTAKLIDEKFGHLRVGDGVQEGDIFVNNDAEGIHGVVSDLARKADY